MKLQDIKADKSLWEKANIDGVGKLLLVEESYYDGIVECVEKTNLMQMNFYKVSSEGLYSHIKVIAASNNYEAIGYFVLETQKEGIELEEVCVQEMSPDEKIEVTCIGLPIYKTVEEIYEGKSCEDMPCIVTSLLEI